MKQRIFALLAFFLSGCSTKNRTSIKIDYPPGGYKYPISVTKEDSGFYFLPMKNVFSKRDSLVASYYDSIFFTFYNEPNISIAPLKKSVFRLSYYGGTPSHYKPILITLKEDSIIIKEGISGFYYPEFDTNRLSIKEREDFGFLENWYPLDDPKYDKARREYFLSFIHKRPELSSPHYYKRLWQKATFFSEKIVYNTRYKKISVKTYIKLVTALNSSVFWSCPIDCSCNESVMGGSEGFTLEANTPDKYHMVSGSSCFGGPGSLVDACQKLVAEAGLENKIELVWTKRDSSTLRKTVEPRPMEIYQGDR